MKKKTQKNTSKPKVVVNLIIFMIIFIGELFFYTWSRVQCVRLGYAISKQKDEYRYLMTLQNNLQIELARLKSPKRLAEIAKNQIGLATPGPEQMIIIP